MDCRVDDAISRYLLDQSTARLHELDRALVEENFCVPLGADVTRLSNNKHKVIIRCIRTEAGTGAVPVFTTPEHLLKWKPAGCPYVVLAGAKVIQTVNEMQEISEILINPADAPRGSIPRSDFVRMLALV